MERLVPDPVAAPFVQARAGSAALHNAAYTLLALMVAGAAWVRFNDQIVASVPALAGSAAAVAVHLADASRIKGLVELPILSASASGEAVAGMALPAAEAQQLTEALQRRRLRLVRMPLLDISATLSDQGRSVQVSAGGYTRMVKLSRTPIAVALPIGPVGSVSFQTGSADGVMIGAMTLAGLARLPALAPGATLAVGVVAQ